jgi:hypothetical protein
MKVVFRERLHKNRDEEDQIQYDWVVYGDNDEPMGRSTESYDDEADSLHCFELITGLSLDVAGTHGLPLTASGVGPRFFVVEFERLGEELSD